MPRFLIVGHIIIRIDPVTIEPSQRKPLVRYIHATANFFFVPTVNAQKKPRGVVVL